MKAILKGGPADGRETDVDPMTKKIVIPVQGKRRFGQVLYSRTDKREDGAVIYDCGMRPTRSQV